MNNKILIQALGFLPKENTSGIFQKKYSKANNYAIEIDFEKEIINFGNKVKGESKTTQNFSQAENWVVLECLDRLLEKGYQPQNITLEKTWKTGHGTSGRLDILVSKDDGSAYLMIECKNWGTEFEKELKNLEKNGGQLFTYFQQDKNAEVLMLYTSKLEGKNIDYKNIIVKIEDDYRQTGNVKDFYERWNKLPKANGIFENWVTPYELKSKALTWNTLKELKQEDSSFIFNRFLEILRHNVVSDKPNAFNKIFTLFLCKIVDEYSKAGDDELEFQWLEGQDNHIKFQKRLTDLYRKGMKELLEKNVMDVSDEEFDKRFEQVDERYRSQIKDILTEVRLKKNNEFAIKEVYDDVSFEDNAKVVKEVVELLQGYKIRYNYRQQFLSDFFELLLTTGLKQESGQFFTPVPIARFIIKSLPIQEIASKKIEQGNKNDLLPTIIDYSAGSGHFITESMEVVQKYIDKLELKNYKPETRKQIDAFQRVQFDWAEKYVYAIEKDYRLVKTAKVSCYLHGDGLAKIIHGDGLGDFATSNDFKGLLKASDKTYPQDNKQFDIVISNPPYSVSAFKGTMMEEGKAKQAFDLYSRLTDQSSEIECLFIERTKQLLKDGGVAGIILPSSILNNTSIYTQAREIILRYFDILAITELGSGTFMATGTNTVTLFLRRRNNADALNIEEAVKKFFANLVDVTINGIEKPVKKYISYVWEGLSLDDYISLLSKKPNEAVRKHEIYKEYDNKIRAKDEAEKWNNILAVEQEKLLYFIIAYPQKLVLVKTGEKNEEKRFLGYEFSNRRGSEGIHPIQRGKTIDDCTQLFDAETFDNPEKASTYIYKAFQGDFDVTVSENLQQNVSYQNLVDMLTFDRITFEKNISLSAKKKNKIESKWRLEKLEKVAQIVRGVTYSKQDQTSEKTKNIILTADNITLEGKFEVKKKVFLEDNFELSEDKKLRINDIFICFSSGSKEHLGKVAYIYENTEYYAGGFMGIIRTYENCNPKFLFQLFNSMLRQTIRDIGSGSNINNLSGIINEIKIPLPPKDVQEKIVREIEVLEEKEKKTKNEIEKLKYSMTVLFVDRNGQTKRLDEICELKAGKFVKAGDILNENNMGLYPCYGGNGLRGYTKTFTNDGLYSLVGRQGALCGNVHLVSGKFHATEHALVAFPKNDVNTIWLHHQLVFMNLNQYATGTAQPGLSVINLNPIQINIPSISEQEKIVAQIEEIESKIAELEKEIAEIPKQKEAILKKYLN